MTARTEIARQTIEACNAGYYTRRDGTRVELAPAIAAATTATVSHDLATDRFDALVPRFTTSFTVTGQSTIEAVARLAPTSEHLGCLNFASAKNPGGGFLNGAQAQEEALARSSALYPCLLTQPAHYKRNRACGSLLYLDLAVFSPRVPVFRDDDGGWFAAPVLASMITCAAPNAGALANHPGDGSDLAKLEPTLRRRADYVLAIAAHHRITHLVLGAWGSGVFRNDPVLVADAFMQPLRDRYAGVFAEVCFAVLGGPGNRNHDVFANALR